MDQISPMETGLTLKKGAIVLIASMGMLVLISLLFIHFDWDRRITSRFFSPDTGWYLKDAQPWRWLYRYGTIPGVTVTLAALAGAVITRLRAPAGLWHRYLLLVVLVSAIGGGLIVNGILKPYWGRPRPNQIQELGGQYIYRHVLEPGTPGKGKSFPSGHPTMGFLFVSLVYFRRKSIALAWIGGIGGLAYGSMLSVARVVQGAHFVTDCIWSLGVIWLVASACYYFVLRIPAMGVKLPRTYTRGQRYGLWAVGVLLAGVILLTFLTRRPFYETYYFNLGNEQTTIRELRVGLENGAVRTHVRYSDYGPLFVLVHAQGFAWTGASVTPDIVSSQHSGGRYHAIYRMKENGYFSELTHEMEVVIPRHLKDRVQVVFLDETGKPTPS